MIIGMKLIIDPAVRFPHFISNFAPPNAILASVVLSIMFSGLLI